MSASRHWLLISASLITALAVGQTQGRGPQKLQQPLLQEFLRIPMAKAAPGGLEALLVRPNEAGAHPLAIITHGTPFTAAERAAMTPQRLLPIAMEFARRGWTAVIVMRRNYGLSSGGYAESIFSCSTPDYMHAAVESARDLRAAIAYLSTLPDVDPTRIIVAGGSSGGMAAVALTANPPPGLVAGISFAGGLGHFAPGQVCQPGSLLSTFYLLGKKSRIPMLWVYAENDHFFSLELARSLHREFTRTGGRATLVITPPYGQEGHFLFSFEGVPFWTRYLDDFLQAQHLALRRPLLPLQHPHLPPPRQLSAAGRAGFQLYLAAPPEKAFAMSASGSWGYGYGYRTAGKAQSQALQSCEKYGAKCRIVPLGEGTH